MELNIKEQHKKECKDLQAKIQQIKHAVPKGDKKRQKEAKAQIALMEAELDAKHEEELKVFNAQTTSVEQLEEKVQNISIQNGDEESVCNVPKKSKAAKRREKKEREERERNQRIAEQEIENRQGPRHIEQQCLYERLTAKGLCLYDIPSDGNCLYQAVCHQLSINGEQLSVAELRKHTADVMRCDPDEYMPYISTADGEFLDEQGFQKYCDRVEHTSEWGGHVELKAISTHLKRPVAIIHASQDDTVISHSNRTEKPITVVYHRHLYELGEHYNSVVPANSTNS